MSVFCFPAVSRGTHHENSQPSQHRWVTLQRSLCWRWWVYSPCLALCWQIFLCVLQCSCLKSLRRRRLFTWLWSTPAEVSDPPPPSSSSLPSIECYQLAPLLLLNYTVQLMNPFIMCISCLVSLPFSPFSLVRNQTCQISLLYFATSHFLCAFLFILLLNINCFLCTLFFCIILSSNL